MKWKVKMERKEKTLVVMIDRTVSHHFLSQQRRRTPLWTKIMKINSFFGTEDFYIPMGVFILW